MMQTRIHQTNHATNNFHYHVAAVRQTNPDTFVYGTHLHRMISVIDLQPEKSTMMLIVDAHGIHILHTQAGFFFYFYKLRKKTATVLSFLHFSDSNN